LGHSGGPDEEYTFEAGLATCENDERAFGFAGED